jgi:sigma-B regulation protein RsbU (phosphoserine phosphatase)
MKDQKNKDADKVVQEIHSSSSPDEWLSVPDKLRMLLEITRTISVSMDVDEVLKLVMDTLSSLVPFDAAGIYLLEKVVKDDHAEYVFKSKRIRGYRISFELVEPKLKLGEGFIGYVAETGESLISSDVSKDPRYFPARKRTNSEMIAPIVSNDEVIGVFDLESDKLEAYTEDDLAILQLLASQVAIILEKSQLYSQLVEKKRLEAQLEIAREVQLELLPDEDPVVSGFDISAYIFPTEEVSGDYYDWVNLYDDQIAIIVADAVGKGIPAALLMAFLRAALRAGVQIGYAPQVAFTKVGELLWDSIESHQFITAIYGILDATNRTFVYSNAGHNPPLLMNSDGKCRFVDYGDLPLGMFHETAYHQHFLRLEAGQMLVLYTDGITEAENAEGEEFGQQRFMKTLKEGFDLSAKELIKFVREELNKFTGSEYLNDDGTLFIVKSL